MSLPRFSIRTPVPHAFAVLPDAPIMKPSNSSIWTAESLSRALGANMQVQPQPMEVSHVETRAERCSIGALFVPVLAPYFPTTAKPDPHEEVQAIRKAFDHGATIALSSLGPEHVNEPIWRVANTKRALELLAQFARDRFGGVVVAVTGSIGKTTTKDMIHQVFSRIGTAQSTVENRAGPAEFLSALASVSPDVGYLTLETSSSAPGLIGYRARLGRPNIAVVTNVGLSHATNYSSPDEIMAEKLSLLDYAPDGVAIVHRSVITTDRGAQNLLPAKPVARTITVGDAPGDDVRLCDARLVDGILNGVVSLFGERHHFTLPLPARHFAENMLFALAAAHVVGIPIREAIHALGDFSTTNARMTRWRVQMAYGILEMIDDSCNAAPKSVEGLLDVLSHRRDASRTVFVLGDMLELGPQEETLHELLAPAIEHAGIGLLITVGPLASRVCDLLTDNVQTLQLKDFGEAVHRVPSLLRHGDLVAIKGSHNVKLQRLVREIMSRALKVSRPSPSWQIENSLRWNFRR